MLVLPSAERQVWGQQILKFGESNGFEGRRDTRETGEAESNRLDEQLRGHHLPTHGGGGGALLSITQRQPWIG